MSLVVNIAKNEKIELSKHSNVSEVEIGLSWEANSTPSRPFDLDASVLMLDANNKLLELVFYNNLRSTNDAVVHNGDEREGSSSNSYEEEISVKLASVPASIKKLAVAVSIHRSTQLGLKFGQVRNALIDVMPKGDTTIRHTLSSESADKAAVIIAEIIRSDNNRWEVVGGGPGFNDFSSLLTSYGAII